nr:hypothetical protein [Neobacillus sp. Marseille-Q6967]
MPAVLVEMLLAVKRDRMEGGNPGGDIVEIQLTCTGIYFKEGRVLLILVN